MNPEQITLVQNTFKHIQPIAETAAGLFYNRLFELDPSLRPMFKNDIKEQGKKLMQALAFVVKGLKKPDTIIPVTPQIKLKNQGPPQIKSEKIKQLLKKN